MNLKNLFLVTLLLTTIGLVSCGDDAPVVSPTLPRASFTFEANDLTINFSSTSENANSFAWDFGDGNQGTGATVSHTYEKGDDYTVKLKASNADGENETSQSITVVAPELYKTSGFFVSSYLSSSAGFSSFAGYFPDAPTGNIDLTQYQAFPNIIIRAQHGPFMYGRPLDNTEGISKYAIDAETNQLVELETLPTLDNSSRVVILNEELGFFTVVRELAVRTFNPTTMQELGKIDLRDIPSSISPDNTNGVLGLTYNEKTGKILASLFTDDPNTGQFYDDLSTHIAVIDVASQSFEKMITHPEATYPIFRGEDNAIIDEDGNTYYIAAGSYGLDNQIGPTAAKGSRPQIIKINTNSEFEVDYAWNPIDKVGLQNNFFQIFTAMVYAGNGKAYGIGTVGPETDAILQLLQKLAMNTITAAEFDQLRFMVFADESQAVMEIDLNSKAASFVSGIPMTASFAYPYMYKRGNKVYTQVTANQGTLNGYYEIDIATGQANEMFNISQGGFAGQFLEVGLDND